MENSTGVIPTLLAEALLGVVLIGLIYWFFFRRSQGTRRGGATRVPQSEPGKVPRSSLIDAQEEWPALAQKMAAGWLIVVEGADKGAHHAVGKGTTLIGRASSCDVILADPAVSRRHADITAQADRFLIRDVGSTSGTFVDGERLEPFKGALLHPGSVISMGTTSLLFKEPKAGARHR